MEAITLRAARVIREKSMKEMAALLGIERTTYGKRERNPHRFSAQDAQRICKYLGFAIEDILDFQPHDIT